MSFNKQIQHQCNFYAELLHLHRTNGRLANQLFKAASTIHGLDKEVREMTAIEMDFHFRPQAKKIIRESIQTGKIAALEDLIQKTPSGLINILQTGELTGRKLSVIWKKGKIDTVDALIRASLSGKLARLPGFGRKTEQHLLSAIETIRKKWYFNLTR